MEIPPPLPPPTTTISETTTNYVINHHQLPQIISIPYGKCTKNYAATNGGLVLDGCGEFMPSLNATPTDPAFLNCDACGCHRSFHRETDHSYQPVHHVIQYHCPPQNSPTPDSSSPPPISSSYYPPAPRIFLPLNQGLPPQPTNNHQPSVLTTTTGIKRNATRRFRSKFSEDQKAKMQEFAERIGWKMLKKDEEMILRFCEGIGVGRGVFKVWMHNHRNTSVRNNHRYGGGNTTGANGSSSSS